MKKFQFSKYCSPAQLYLVLGTIGIIGAFFNNYSIETLLTKALFLVIWAWVLNWLCSKGFKAISWILVLLPFIMVLFTYFLTKDVVNVREGIDSRSNASRSNAPAPAPAPAPVNTNATPAAIQKSTDKQKDNKIKDQVKEQENKDKQQQRDQQREQEDKKREQQREQEDKKRDQQRDQRRDQQGEQQPATAKPSVAAGNTYEQSAGSKIVNAGLDFMSGEMPSLW